MKYEFEKPKYKKLIEILEESARCGRLGRSNPSGFGLDVSDIDIKWLYEKLVSLGAELVGGG